MKIITPIDIDESMMSSNISEPDASVGEVEWVDPNAINEFGNLSGRYGAAVLSGNGYVYGVGSDNEDVIKINTEDKTVSYFGDAPDQYSVFLIGDFIYCMAITRDAESLKIDTTTDTVSVISSLSGYDQMNWVRSNDGSLYGATNYSKNFVSDNKVYKVNTTDDSVTELFTPSQGYSDFAVANSGNIYAIGGVNDLDRSVLKIDVETGSLSEFGSYDLNMIVLSAGSDGNIYAAGSAGYVLKIDTSTDTIDTIPMNYGFFVSVVSSGDYIYFCTASGIILSFYVPDNTYVAIGTSQGGTGYYDLGIDSFGRLMAAGFSEEGTTDNVMIVNTNNNTVEAIHTGYTSADEVFTDESGNVFTICDTGILYLNGLYNTGDQVILTETHKVYECVLDNTQDDPATGAVKVPPSWAELYPTNRWRMYDYTINSKSTMAATVGFVELTPLQPVTTISLFGLDDITHVYVLVYEDDENGDLIYNSSQSLILDSPDGDSDLNGDLYISKVIFDDLPDYATPYIKVSCNKVSGASFSVGAVAIGNPRSMGVMTYLSTTSRTSFDTVEIDDFGNEETISRPSAEYTSFEMVVPPVYADYVERMLKDALNKPRVYYGNKKDGEKIFTFGRYERSPISYDNPAICTTNLKVRGLV